MHRLAAVVTLLWVALTAAPALSSPTPGPSRSIAVRQSDAVQHCVDDNNGPNSYGNLFCLTNDGQSVLSCDECLGLNGNEPARTANGNQCFFTKGPDSGGLGDTIPCPGDPPPDEKPDGSPNDIAGDILDVWCAAAGALNVGGWTNFGLCYGWAQSRAGGNEYEEIKAGITGKFPRATFQTFHRAFDIDYCPP